MPARALPYEEWVKLPRVKDLDRKPSVGDLVAIRSRGLDRLARVTKVGRTRLYTEYTTESALRDAERFGTSPVVTRKSADMEDPWLRYVGRSA
jgi:hypothetical protein